MTVRIDNEPPTIIEELVIAFRMTAPFPEAHTLAGKTWPMCVTIPEISEVVWPTEADLAPLAELQSEYHTASAR